MSPDQADPDKKSKNIAQEHSDEMFNAATQPTDPGLKSAENDAGGNLYKAGSSSEDLADQEASGGFYKNESQAPAGRIQNGFNSLKKGFSKGSGKKKAMYAAAGAGGGGLIVATIIILFLLVSGFGVGQAAEVMQIANYSRAHLAHNRRATQYITEKALNPNPEAFRVNTQKRTVLDRMIKFDPNKIMGNLRSNNDIEFVRKDGTRRRFAVIGREVPLSELDSIRFGNGDLVKLPQGASRYSERAQRDFVKKIDRAVSSSDALAGRSRIHRTKTANAIIKASDIRLYRWEKAGRSIKTFKDALLSSYDRLKGRYGTSSIPEANEAAEEYKKSVTNSPDDALSSGDVGDKATRQALSRANGFRNFIRAASISSLGSTLYCSGKDYIEGSAESSKQRVKQYKQSAYLTLSAYEQAQHGDTTSTAVMMEAKSLNGFSDSKRYQLATGNANAVSMEEDLDRSESPVEDKSSPLYQFYFLLIAAIEGVVPPLRIDSVRRPACQLLMKPVVQVFIVFAENIASAVASYLTAGAAGGAQQATLVAIRGGFMTTARHVLTREARREIIGQASRGMARDALTFLLIDMILKTVHNTGGNSTLDDGYKQYAKKDIGLKLDANEKMHSVGGRKLNPQEVAELDSMIKEERFATIHKQPLVNRLFGLTDPLSPASLATATLPYSPESLHSKSVGFVKKSLNPLQTLAQNSSRIASAVLGSDKVLATEVTGDDENLDIPTIGFSKTEMEKMLDKTYWPLANAQYVESHPEEFEEYKDCFLLMTDTVEPACGDKDMTSNRAFRARLYQMDGGNASEIESELDFDDGVLGGLIYLQDTTETASAPADDDDTIPGGDAKTLAQQILNNPRITYTTPLARQAMEATAAGQPAPIEERCNAGSSAPLSPTLLGVMLKVAERYSVGYGYFTNGCHSSGSLHYSGKAADINQVNGVRATGGDADRPFMQYLTGILPDGSRMGEVNCSNIPINPINDVTLHSDSCNHIHIGVP